MEKKKDLGVVSTEAEKKEALDKLPFYKNWRFYVYTLIALCLSFLAISSLLNGCAIREVQKQEQEKSSLVSQREPNSLGVGNGPYSSLVGSYSFTYPTISNVSTSKRYYLLNGTLYESTYLADLMTYLYNNGYRRGSSYPMCPGMMAHYYNAKWHMIPCGFQSVQYGNGSESIYPIPCGFILSASDGWSIMNGAASPGQSSAVTSISTTYDYNSCLQWLVNTPSGFSCSFSVGDGSDPASSVASAYSQGYEDGYGSGYSIGEDQGYADGFSSGAEYGYSTGYSEGYETGNSEGYSDGYSTGYSEGFSTAYEPGWSAGFSSAMQFVDTTFIKGSEIRGLRLLQMEGTSQDDYLSLFSALYYGGDGDVVDVYFTNGDLLKRVKTVDESQNLVWIEAQYFHNGLNGGPTTLAYSSRQGTGGSYTYYGYVVDVFGGSDWGTFAYLLGAVTNPFDDGGYDVLVRSDDIELSYIYPVYYTSWQAGYEAGSSAGYIDGYASGSSIGYINGRNAAEPSALTETLVVVFQQPFNQIYRFLNFNVLGLNLLALSCGIITLFIVVKVVKKII